VFLQVWTARHSAFAAKHVRGTATHTLTAMYANARSRPCADVGIARKLNKVLTGTTAIIPGG